MMSLQPIPPRIIRLRRAAIWAFFRSVHPIRVLRLWHSRHKERQWLISMDDAMLRDIGITRADAWLEWEKPFWRA